MMMSKKRCGEYDLSLFSKSGKALIFNHFEFKYDKSMTRRGTHADIKQLYDLLRALRFEVTICDDYSLEKIRKTVKKYATKHDFHGYGCLMVFVLSHGGDDGLLHAQDQSYHVSEIWEPFVSSEALQGKPKLFFFQACRVEDDAVVEHRYEMLQSDAGASNCKSVFPHTRNFLLAYATVDGRLSYRHADHGSWFMQDLCTSLLRLEGGGCDLLSALTDVNRRLLARQSPTKSGQTPVFISYLQYKIVFKLPLNWNFLHPTTGGPRKDSCSEQVYKYASLKTDASNLYSDARSGILVSAETSQQYEILSSSIFAVIYHDGNHEVPASQLSDVLKSLGFNTKQINITNISLKSELQIIASEISVTSLLVVAILASLGEDSVIDQNISFQECSTMFLGSKCPNLAFTPKIFMFFDEENEEKTESDELTTKGKQFSNEHSHFVIICGYGKDSLQSLLQELSHCIHYPTDIFDLLTCVLESSTEGRKGYLARYESTLSKNLVIGNTRRSQSHAYSKVCLKDTTFENKLLSPDEVVTANCAKLLRTKYKEACRIGSTGLHTEAFSMLEEISTDQRKLLGDNHPDVILTLNSQAISLNYLNRHHEALKLYENVMEMQRNQFGGNARFTLQTAHKRAVTLGHLSRYHEALASYEELLVSQVKMLGAEDLDTLQTLHNKASTLCYLGRYTEALTIYNEVFEKRCKILGADHSDTLQTMHDKAKTLNDLNSHSDALKLYEIIVEKRQVLSGYTHPNTLQAMSSKALTLSNLGNHSEALSLYKEVLKIKPGDAQIMHKIAWTLGQLNRHTEALTFYEQVLDKRCKDLGKLHPSTLKTMYSLAVTLGQLGRHTEELLCLENLLEKQRRVLGEEHADTKRTKHNLTSLLKFKISATGL